MNLKSLCLSCFLCFFFSTGAQAGYVLKHESASAQIKEIDTWLAPFLQAPKIFHIGHRMGNFQQYSGDLNVPDAGKIYRPVNDLMDEAFLPTEKGGMGLNGVELDGQMRVDSPDDNEVYITHEPLKGLALTLETKAYMDKNTLYTTLSHFYEKHFVKNAIGTAEEKKIHLELKSLNQNIPWKGHPSLVADDERLVDATFAVIKRVWIEQIAKAKEKHKILSMENLAEGLDMPSFNYFALERMMRHFATEKMPLPSFTQIITSNVPYLIFASKITHDPFLGDFLIEKIRSSYWIKGVWFDPSWVADLRETMNKMQKNRLKPLDFYLSTYGSTQKELLILMNKATDLGKNKINNIAGIIVEVAPPSGPTRQ